MLYLINYELMTNYYMGDTVKSELNRIVKANSAVEAKKKLETHYSDLNDPYCVKYWVNFNYCHEILE